MCERATVGPPVTALSHLPASLVVFGSEARRERETYGLYGDDAVPSICRDTGSCQVLTIPQLKEQAHDRGAGGRIRRDLWTTSKMSAFVPQSTRPDTGRWTTSMCEESEGRASCYRSRAHAGGPFAHVEPGAQGKSATHSAHSTLTPGR